MKTAIEIAGQALGALLEAGVALEASGCTSSPRGAIAKIITQAQAEAYAAGQQAMREAALKAAPEIPPSVGMDWANYSCGVSDFAKKIERLPIQPMPEGDK